MENQNPNNPPIKPDYSFITNQQVGDAPKKRAGKTYAMFISLALLLVMSLTAIVLSNTKKNVAVNNVGQTAAENTVKSFLSRISTGSNTEAYNMISPFHRPSEEFFVQGFAQPISSRYSLDKCTFQENKNDSDAFLTVQSTCPLKEGEKKFTFEFEVVATGTPQIISFEVIKES